MCHRSFNPWKALFLNPAFSNCFSPIPRNPFGDDVNDLDQLEQVHILEREAMELLRQSGDMKGCSIFGWQEVPDFVSCKCCRSLKTQLVVKDLALLQVMPLVAEEDTVPAWLLDRKEESRQKAAAWSLT